MAKFQWRKGQSGNPRGGKVSLKRELEEKLAQKIPKDYLDRTYARAIADRWVHMALKGAALVAIRAIENIADRIEGKPAQAQTVDINLNVSREQRLAKIEELLAILPAPADATPKDDDGPSKSRVN